MTYLWDLQGCPVLVEDDGRFFAQQLGKSGLDIALGTQECLQLDTADQIWKTAAFLQEEV